jgi:uncharacterized membrane protein
MEFIYEASAIIDAPLSALQSDWSDGTCLPRLLTHIRATALGDSEDLFRVVALIDGAHIEFAAQRTMCEDGLICWQNLDDDFYYVLSTKLEQHNDGVKTTITVSYDPPGILPDIMETICLGRSFRHQLEDDVRRYAESFNPRAFMAAINLSE